MARLAPNKEVAGLLREIRKYGYGFAYDGNSHVVILKPDGDPLRWLNGATVTLPSSPGNQKAIGTMRAKLIKAGIPLNVKEEKQLSAVQLQKKDRQAVLRARIFAFLGNEKRGDRRAFVNLALDAADAAGIEIPYGKAKKRPDSVTNRLDSAEKSLGQFLNEINGFNSLTERFWNEALDLLEQKVEPAPVVDNLVHLGSFEGDTVMLPPASGKPSSERPYREAGEALVEGAKAEAREELVMRIVCLAAMAAPEHYAQVVHQSRELVALILDD